MNADREMCIGYVSPAHREMHKDLNPRLFMLLCVVVIICRSIQMKLTKEHTEHYLLGRPSDCANSLL